MSLRIEAKPPADVIARELQPENLYGPALRDFLNRMVLVGQAKARQGAKPHGGDTGGLANSIQTRLDGGSVPLWGEVYTASSYAEPANFGRAPGKMPPIAAIASWARRHGADDPSAAYLIARAIGRRGTQGLHFWEDAESEMDRRMPEFIDRLSQAIGQEWES